MRLQLIFAALLFAASAYSQEKKLPAIELADLNGNKVDVSSISTNNELVIFSFWATWCIPCKKELTNIMKVYDEWKENYNVKLVAVSIDDSRNVAKVKPTVEGSGWEYTVLLDPNQELKRALAFQNVPFTILADESGNIVYQHSGYVDGDEFHLEETIEALRSKN
jgi:peroxiredoxin